MKDDEKHLKFEQKQLSENKSNVGIKKQKKRNREKNNSFLEEDDNVQIKKLEKREKGKKMRDKDKEIDNGMENEVERKGESKGELIGVDGDNVNNGAADIVEKKKKKKRDKGQQRSEGENVFELKRDKNQKKRHGLMRNSEVVDIEARGKEGGTFEEDLEVVVNVERKKRKRDKKQKKRHGLMRNNEIVDIEAGGKDDGTFGGDLEVAAIVKKKKRKRDKNDGSTKSPRVDNDQMLETVKKVKRKKRRAKNDEGDLFVPLQENVLKNVEICIQSPTNDGIVSKKRERGKNLRNNENLEDDSSVTRIAKKKRAKLVEKGSCDTTPNKSIKKVRFSDKVEVFSYLPDNLVIDERFTKEEDEIVINAVYKYIKVHDLGEKGVDMVMNCSKHRELAGCWEEIATAIPYRPQQAIYFRAHTLFLRSEIHSWTEEQFEIIRKWQATHGNGRKPLADGLGKYQQHVKKVWRRIRLKNLKKAHWTQKEYQELFNHVNLNLQLKADEEKKSKHGTSRDNISWTAVSDNLSTQTHVGCCLKWYKQLTSPMVEQGVWADVDDYRLLGILYKLDANCMEDVDWDYLIEDRDGDLCRRRWNEMVLHIGNHGNKSFAEQVEVLAQRYCPKLLEAEASDSKPRVP